MNAMEYFISVLTQIRLMLDNWYIPFLGCSYWDFVMGLAIASVVVTVLVSTVRIGAVSYSSSADHVRRNRSTSSMPTPGTGAYGSYNRSMHQRK